MTTFPPPFDRDCVSFPASSSIRLASSSGAVLTIIIPPEVTSKQKTARRFEIMSDKEKNKEVKAGNQEGSEKQLKLQPRCPTGLSF